MALHLTWNDVQSCQKVLHKAEASLYHYAFDWTSFPYTSVMKLQLMYLHQAPTSIFALAVLSARNGIGDILANISMLYSVISFRTLLTLPRSPFLSKFLKLFIWDSKMMNTSSVYSWCSLGLEHILCAMELRARSDLLKPTSVFFWKISWTKEAGGLRSIGLQRVRHDWACMQICHKLD